MFCAWGPYLPLQQRWKGDRRVRIPKGHLFSFGFPGPDSSQSDRCSSCWVGDSWYLALALWGDFHVVVRRETTTDTSEHPLCARHWARSFTDVVAHPPPPTWRIRSDYSGLTSTLGVRKVWITCCAPDRHPSDWRNSFCTHTGKMYFWTKRPSGRMSQISGALW